MFVLHAADKIPSLRCMNFPNSSVACLHVLYYNNNNNNNTDILYRAKSNTSEAQGAMRAYPTQLQEKESGG